MCCAHCLEAVLAQDIATDAAHRFDYGLLHECLVGILAVHECLVMCYTYLCLVSSYIGSYTNALWVYWLLHECLVGNIGCYTYALCGYIGCYEWLWVASYIGCY